MSANFIERLSRCTRAERAALRTTLRQDDLTYPPRGAMRVVEDFVRSEDTRSHRRKMHYLLAGLYALRYPNPDLSQTGGEPFAQVAARLTKSAPNFEVSKTSSLEKRFLHLLDSERDELAYPLRQWIALVKASDRHPDWVALLNDLGWWNEQAKNEWARAYYRELKLSNLPSEPNQAEKTTTSDIKEDA